MPALTNKKKIIIGITAVIVLLSIIVGNIVASKYKRIIHIVLPKAVAVSTDSLYRITIKNVGVNILTRSVTLKGVHIWADSTTIAKSMKDSTAQANYFDITIPRLKVSSIMWDKLIGGEGFSCGTFLIQKPGITIRKTNKEYTKYDTSKKKEINKEFTASTVKIEDGNIKYVFIKETDTNKISFNNCNATLSNWQFAKEYVNDSNKFFMADYGLLTVGSIKYAPPLSLYNFSCDNIRFNSKESKLTAKDMRMKLRVPIAEFYRKMDVQKEIYDLHFPTIEFDNIDRNKLIAESILSSSTVYLNHSVINVTLDRRHPENTVSKMGKFPNQVLQKMKLTLDIDQIKINNGSVNYSEVSNRTGQKATINFETIDGVISNVTNNEPSLKTDSTAIAQLTCKLNKYTDVTSTFKLSLTDPKGFFSLDAQMGGLQSHQLSKQIKAFSLIELKSLNMKSLSLQLRGNEDYASGSFIMLYNNLGIRILKNEKNRNGDKKTKGFLSFIANNMILYSNNPMAGSEVRAIKTNVKRDELKSYFNLIWQNILQGVRETTIRNMNVIEWIKKNDQKNRSLFNRDKKRAKKRDD